MNWTSASGENPGFSVYYADDEDRPGQQYAVQRNRKSTGLWRLFHRFAADEALRTIYVGETLKECKAYADEYRTLVGGMNQ